MGSRLGEFRRGPKTDEKREIVSKCRWVTIQGDKVEMRYWPEDPPVKPEGMPEHASLLWDERVERLITDGIATIADQETLELLCSCWQRVKELEKCLNSFDEEKISSEAYKRVFDQWRYASDKFSKTSELFGMSPKSRGKMLLPSEEEMIRARVTGGDVPDTVPNKKKAAETSRETRKRIAKSKFKLVEHEESPADVETVPDCP